MIVLFLTCVYMWVEETMRKSIFVLALAICMLLMPAAVLAQGGREAASDQLVIRFYYPIGTAGDLANAMNELCAQYSAENPDVDVEPIYAGDYVQTMQRTLTSSKAGNPADIALLTSADVWTAVDEGIILPLQSFIDSEGDGFLDRFFPGMLYDSMVAGEYYAIPFQKSTPIFYYNKDMFREAGLDPEKAPQTWEELAEYAAILTTDDRYGVEIPIDQWLLSIFILQNGGEINNIEGTETYLDTPEAIGAVEYLLDLVNKGYMPAKRLFGDSSSDFVAGKTAMMYNSTGSLAFVRDSASFDWGVGFLPAGKERIVATGGGQFVICSGISEERQAAAWDFIKWMTEPAQTAKWSMASGFIAVNPAAFDLPEMAEYTAALPQAIVARDQLQYAVGEPPKTHDAREVSQAMASMFENMLAGNISPEEGMQELQASCDSILAEYN